MNAFRLRLTTAAVALAVAVGSFVPAQAMQLPAAPQLSDAAAVTDVQDVQYRRHYDRRDRRDWHNGHRGYRDRRPGYRYHNGLWFPLAAFGAGAIIGGAVASDRGSYSSRHVAWCESRYRTYRASDNSYVASGGVRRSCNSPY
ncbi:BA14K family protein [Rhizobium deserti]|uniref:Lectin-like protein BA14k n=1 Tax=Rhizobium deserti TaxID=2547961 RepID=A0A4R5UKY6_9HYPH|nr:BA14K family protein [Rhizobium deserti]TDK37463.1 BA14K family protein [Rhizobium deserti]